MSASAGFRIHSPPITHQTIDGEVVIINLDNGCYYSLRQSGAAIWQLIEGGVGTEAIVEQLALRYDADRAGLAAAVDLFLGELHQEGLIVPHSLSPIAATPASSLTRVAFEPPVLEKFTDMKDLLLLDPIHEVDETGWPNAAAAAPATPPADAQEQTG